MSTETTKVARAAAVSRALSDAACRKSEESPSRVRGCPNVSAGFKVTQGKEGAYVHYVSFMGADADARVRERSRAREYRKVLERKFAVELVESEAAVYLKVTLRPRSSS